MADYYCSFNGHLLEGTRPEGWPTVVKDEFVYRANTPEVLVDYMNKRAAQVQINGGLHIIKEKILGKEDEQTNGSFNEGAFVPLHMFSYIDYTVKQLMTPMPDMNDEGLIKQ